MAQFRVILWLLAVVVSWAALQTSSSPHLAQRPLLAGPRPKTPFTDDFNKFVASTLEDWKVPGLSIAVIDEETTFSEAYGFATLPDVKATPETLWLGASTTKAFVGAALAHMIQNTSYPALSRGWSTPISSLIPDDFVLMDDWATQHLTLEDAISHRTGMPRHDLSWTYTANGSRVPIRDVVRSLRYLPAAAPSRTVFQYCNLMYIVLSHVVETLTKEDLKTTLKELIWGPLEMRSTYLDLRDAEASPHHLATGYFWDNDTESHGAIHVDTLQQSGAAGIITNVVDLAHWVRCLLYERAPFTNETHSEIRKPRMIASAEPSSGFDVTLYGLGWQRTLFHGETLYKHNGQGLSFGATIYWLPDRKYGVVSMGNIFLRSNYAQDVITRKLIEDVMGVDPAKRFDVSKKSKESMGKEDREVEQAEELLYPDLPSPRLPSSVALGELVGEYYDQGYGRMRFEPDGTGETGDLVLVAERMDMVYQYQVRLEHAHGDDWVAYFVSSIHSRLPLQFFKAAFKIIEGKVSTLDITFTDGVPGTQEWIVSFRKVASQTFWEV